MGIAGGRPVSALAVIESSTERIRVVIQLGQLASLVGGELIGPDLACAGANPPEDASGQDITLLDDPERVGALHASEACAVVTASPIDGANRSQIVVSDPHQAFATIVAHFRPPARAGLPGVGVDSSAKIAPTAKIHPTATVGAGVVIGERTLVMPGVVIMPQCVIGEDCILHPHVTLYEYTQLGDRVILHAGCVVGANGFGYRQEDGRHVLSAQLGYVVIESDVDAGACVTIDRGTYGATRIGAGTKIDNQVMIAHNCQIGRHNLLCSQVGIAGSCRTGDYVILAGQVGLKDHITLGDGAIVGAQAGVMNDLPGNEVYLGAPATSQREQMQIFAVTRRLPEMRRELKQLRAAVDALQTSLAEYEGQDKRAA
jgi:UDP-3-O-[3-hydroxymyristoyl] glucosamine N-acyltransferase